MSYEKQHVYSLTNSLVKRHTYGIYGIPPFITEITNKEIGQQITDRARLIENSLKEIIGTNYLYNCIPAPTLQSLGKASVATRVVVDNDPTLTFTKDRIIHAFADDWIYAISSDGITTTGILEKPKTPEVLGGVLPGDYLTSAYGLSDVHFDSISGSVSITPWLITCNVGRRNYEECDIPANVNIAGGIDIIEAIRRRLITFQKKYLIRAVVFETLTLDEAELVVNGERSLEGTANYSKEIDLSNFNPNEYMFEHRLRSALMDIPNVNS